MFTTKTKGFILLLDQEVYEKLVGSTTVDLNETNQKENPIWNKIKRMSKEEFFEFLIDIPESQKNIYKVVWENENMDPLLRMIKEMNEKEFFEFIEKVDLENQREVFKAFRFRNL